MRFLFAGVLKGPHSTLEDASEQPSITSRNTGEQWGKNMGKSLERHSANGRYMNGAEVGSLLTQFECRLQPKAF